MEEFLWGNRFGSGLGSGGTQAVVPGTEVSAVEGSWTGLFLVAQYFDKKYVDNKVTITLEFHSYRAT